MAVSTQKETLIEEREAEMVSKEKPSFRIAHFLKPSLPSSSTQTKTLINPPPIITHPTKPISSILQYLSPNVHFHGWRCPQKKWNSWVEKLTPTFQSTWKKACIFEAIMGSTLEIPRCKISIFAFAERWCPETSSFVLPWGEVTLTLEDIMILGGYPVTGHSVLSEVSSKKDLEVEEYLLKKRLEIVKSNSKRASQHKWIDFWMENGSEFEHEAFLSFWLSRYVLPADSLDTINKNVFQIAIYLAKGSKIALAPAVLSSIYRDLRLLNEKVRTVRNLSDQNGVNVKKLAVWAPLQLLQAWILERFPTLNPKSNSMSKGLCRLEMWHKVKVCKIDDIGKVIDSSGGNFKWRPYSAPLNNLPFDFDFDLESYVRCIRVAQLVGFKCCEPYFPHRVAMQFGLDQDIPVAFSYLSETRDNVWSYYNRPIGDINLYKPPKSFQSAMSSRYLDWWKKSNFVKESASCERKEGYLEMSMAMGERLRIKMENNEAEVPPEFGPSRRRVTITVNDGFDEDQPCWKRSKRSSGSQIIEIKSTESNASSGSFRIKEEKAEEEEDDDHITLSQLFKVKDSNSDTFLLNYHETPLYSAGDNAFIQEENPVPNYIVDKIPSEDCTQKILTIEDGSESNADNPIKCEVQTSYVGGREPLGIDLLARIVRLQKIVDMVKEHQTNIRVKINNPDC